MPVQSQTGPQAGATAPAALAGTLVQVVAETLAGLTAINLVRPGHPVIAGGWPFVSDLRRRTDRERQACEKKRG